MAEKVEQINPYGSDSPKHEQVRDMFNSIAPAYDLMNRMMTFGIDRRWRTKAVRTVAVEQPENVLDIATGTGDLAIKLAREIPGASVTGVDLSEGMIEIGRKKITREELDNRVALLQADALKLPFEADTFNAITVAYGVRNFEHLDRGYGEMLRVLKPGGILCVLELTPPKSFLVKPFYSFYTRCIIPLVGRCVSNDSRAYTYLPESIRAVPARENMLELMKKAGFKKTSYKSLTFGVCTLYIARKTSEQQ